MIKYMLSLMLLFCFLDSAVSAESKESKFRMQTRLNLRQKLTDGMDQQLKNGDLSKGGYEFYKMLLNENISTAECNKKVKSILRKAYSSPNNFGGEISVIYDSQGKGISAYPYVLYVLRGSMVGFYEYSHLLGYENYVITTLFNSPNKEWFTEDVLKYQIFCFTLELQKRKQNFYTNTKKMYVSTKIKDRLIMLHKHYSTNKMLNKFILEYPFEIAAYFSETYALKCNKANGLPNGFLEINDYADKLIDNPSIKERFLKRAYIFYPVKKEVKKMPILDKNTK